MRGKGGSERAGESHPLLPDLAFIQHALDGLGNLCVCVCARVCANKGTTRTLCASVVFVHAQTHNLACFVFLFFLEQSKV